MNTLSTITRIILAALLITLGLNGFFNFLPYPEMSDSAIAFMGAINSAKKPIPFALIMVFPILINAMIFHLSLDPEGILFATICFVCNIFLLYTYRENYKTLF